VKNPGTAAVLSFLITGLGRIYNGQVAKGLFLLFATHQDRPDVCADWVYRFHPALDLCIDAYRGAERINARGARQDGISAQGSGGVR
jgi:hypothetical protein